jgi:PAS domain S-box-containing protein
MFDRTHALDTTDRRLFEAFQHAAAGIAITSIDGGFLDVNPAYCAITGRTCDELLQDNIFEITHPDDKAASLAGVQQLLNGEISSFVIEKRYVRPRGDIVWVRNSVTAPLGGDGRPTNIIAICEDISDRRRAEEALAENARQFRQITESLPQLVWTARADGYHDYFNGRWYEYTGMPAGKTDGEAWSRLLHQDDLNRTLETWGHSIATGEPYRTECRIRRQDGEYRWFLALAQPLRDAEGTVVRWFGTCTDIEDKRKAEEALRKAEKLAAVGRLASSIAHEINNPLEAVTNLVYLAMRGDDPNKVRAHLKIAEQELARASHITTQTLRFHRQQSSPVATNLAEVIDSILLLYQGKLANASIAAIFEKTNAPPLMCYSGEMRQMLANLISNAIDAMPDGGRLCVRIRPATDWRSGEDGVRITISDTGKGMSESIKRRIYEPFFTTKGTVGTGLGLWVSAEIVEKHGGSMHVRSSKHEGSKGTTFTLILPYSGARGSVATIAPR